MRPSIEPATESSILAEDAESLGPYQITSEIVPGKWKVATDPVLRRQVWLLRRQAADLPPARRDVSRAGRQRWLQSVTSGGAAWDAFEASEGVPLRRIVDGGKTLPWSTLRHWLHDVASEVWAATGDRTLPAELSIDHIWITASGQAVLLDRAWPGVATPAASIPVGDLAGQQRFLDAVAACVESTGLPLHARPVLKNLEEHKFEKLSFLTGTLRGLLDRPAKVSRAVRAGSIFMLPFYIWVAFVVGRYHDKPWDDPLGILVISTLVVLGAIAFFQLLGLPFRLTASHSIFRLAVVDERGEPAGPLRLLRRWAIVWLPLLVPVTLAVGLTDGSGSGSLAALVLILAWLGATLHAVAHPHRGLPDRDRVSVRWIARRNVADSNLCIASAECALTFTNLASAARDQNECHPEC